MGGSDLPPGHRGASDTYIGQGPLSISNVILLASDYDLLLLDDRGDLANMGGGRSSEHGTGRIVSFHHAREMNDALKMAEEGWGELVIMFNLPLDTRTAEFARELRSKVPSMGIAVLTRDLPGPGTKGASELVRDLDGAFAWTGERDVLQAIIGQIEDRWSSQAPLDRWGPRTALIFAPSAERSTKLFLEVHRQISRHQETLISEAPTKRERMIRARRRPMIVIARDLPELERSKERFADRMLFLILDLTGTDPVYADRLLRAEGQGQGPSALVLYRGSELKGLKRTGSVRYCDLENEGPSRTIIDFINEHLGANELVFGAGHGAEISRARDLRSLELALYSLPEDVFKDAMREGSMFRWLTGRGEFELVEEMRKACSKDAPWNVIKDDLTRVLRERRYRSMEGPIAEYAREKSGTRAEFSRIGHGSLGGKGRGLAFLSKTVKERFSGPSYPGMNIRVPRTIAICTDVFDQFLEANRIDKGGLSGSSDERIVQLFLDSDLPVTVLGDIRAFAEDVRNPVVVRSSSLLEDALFQPFAGIYSSVMLSNSGMDVDSRFQNICTAIKFVYSSTFFEKAREYLRSTGNSIMSEKMAVLVQEVAGQRHGDLYYPNISGVARSYDYWPMGGCANSDGTVNLAFGLGKTIVDGGSTFRFCPVHPNMSMVPSPKEAMRYSQKKFYAIRVGTHLKRTGFHEDIQLVSLDVADAEPHGTLELAASTYSPEDDRIYPGCFREGPRVIDFAPLLAGTLPLPELLSDLLRTGRDALRCPIEMEFAMNVNGTDPMEVDLYLLQIRSMVARKEQVSVDLNDLPKELTLLSSRRAMGQGRTEVSDVVMVKGTELEMSLSAPRVKRINELNRRLADEKRPYMLIGPGRWGSCDPWLGIPVIWSDISGVKVMVERPVGERMIDPSQGSHFFQNLTSLRLFYLTLGADEDSEADWSWLKGQYVMGEDDLAVHIRTKDPIEVLVDGANGKGAVLKRKRTE